MKKRSIVFSCVLAMLYFTLSSDIDGAAHHGHGDITGAHTGAAGHCQTSSCHGANNVLNIVQLQVIDTNTMLPVTAYHAGQSYLVTVTGDATAVATNLPGFGFQVSAALGTHALAGSYTIPAALASSIHTYPCGTTTVVEHSVVLPQTTAGINKYATQFYWTAPAFFSDSVTFFTLLNAVNGNGSSSGDYPNAAPLVTIHEDATEQVSAVSIAGNDITVYPNPSQGKLTVTATEKITSLTIINLLGQHVYSQEFNAGKVQIDISNLPNDVYFIQVNNGATKRFVKQ